MNENRRKQIRKLEELIEKQIAQAAQNLLVLLEQARDEAQQIVDDEQESLDNLPESLAGSDKADAMTEAIGAMTEAVDKLDEIFEGMNEVVDNGIREIIEKTDEAKGSE